MRRPPRQRPPHRQVVRQRRPRPRRLPILGRRRPPRRQPPNRDERMTIAPRAGDALLVVDIQYDFLPGGRLAVAGGFSIIPLINDLAKRFRSVVLTQDWHPQGHISFASKDR